MVGTGICSEQLKCKDETNVACGLVRSRELIGHNTRSWSAISGENLTAGQSHGRRRVEQDNLFCHRVSKSDLVPLMLCNVRDFRSPQEPFVNCSCDGAYPVPDQKATSPHNVILLFSVSGSALGKNAYGFQPPRSAMFRSHMSQSCTLNTSGRPRRHRNMVRDFGSNLMK